MEYEIVKLEEKIVLGVSAVTSNDDPNMGKVIGGLWEKLYQGGINETIKNKVNEYAIGLYSDYEDNKYVVTVGNEVCKAENEALTIKKIPAGKYAKFSIEGHMEKAVAEAWSKIWQMNLDRSYEADFEEYLNSDFNNAKVDIYISLK
ncbi:putative transcriptional regulator YdeE [Clostridium acetobutylicum]|uniref:Predicted transcriptional regulator component, YOBU B.subtilis homolog n=1 Tax=Clostridium acetobutylicum (strain ATCC 824 / DSM 792 / JCM 1419 / IAM 19013 / LMG 5710 / NBRC 13948 / NRRL B-527 / VKM B-1787 / 2291 / W) TaxID=272562 RepID=Q97DI4_CLOAB|nr:MULTISPECIES: effector binding domain-containing protein [Clostridium]AAK81419.1 Predicted transcriptional regulator component, YOBU B.subtilis homolog [Clostridium acetobutylicum ATCC 824]ADZ22534.1 transcriptional regulator component [Clostridium acetobutylicum EA 2018]AEI32886.1 transcriptional regulator [Clostridium acetobutylicum DSM 1731]AWV80910.1 AraC family transcriptional regulator [Clostridium acetobutylicum]MBC2393764.1 AraC family transcriptional regulator [Clostridium acetobut